MLYTMTTVIIQCCTSAITGDCFSWMGGLCILSCHEAQEIRLASRCCPSLGILLVTTETVWKMVAGTVLAL